MSKIINLFLQFLVSSFPFLIELGYINLVLNRKGLTKGVYFTSIKLVDKRLPLNLRVISSGIKFNIFPRGFCAILVYPISMIKHLPVIKRKGKC